MLKKDDFKKGDDLWCVKTSGSVQIGTMVIFEEYSYYASNQYFFGKVESRFLSLPIKNFTKSKLYSWMVKK
jgi:hypothetical protein